MKSRKPTMNATETKKLLTNPLDIRTDVPVVAESLADAESAFLGRLSHDARIAHEQREVIRKLVHALEKRLDGSPWLSDEITPALKAAAPYLCE